MLLCPEWSPQFSIYVHIQRLCFQESEEWIYRIGKLSMCFKEKMSYYQYNFHKFCWRWGPLIWTSVWYQVFSVRLNNFSRMWYNRSWTINQAKKLVANFDCCFSKCALYNVPHFDVDSSEIWWSWRPQSRHVSLHWAMWVATDQKPF
jgi:hypothetical protein